MTRQNLRAKLTMKTLDTTHIEQFNALLRYAFQVTDSVLSELGYNAESIKQAKYPILQNARVLGWFDKDKLISQIALYSMKMNIHNRIFEMGGITGVATYPEYSGMGLMADLMKETLSIMRAQKQSISCLYPYSIPYYRSRGWEIISDKMTFSIKDHQLPNISAQNGMIRRIERDDDEELIALYDRFAKSTHGALVRDKLAWDEYWRWDSDDEMVALYYDKNDVPQGYIAYLLEDDVFKIKEMLYCNEEARRGLWGYVNAHKSMFDKVEGNNFSNNTLAFLLEDGHIKESIQPYFMGRIVDIEQFLRDYPFALDAESRGHIFAFIIKDPLLEWNNRVFVLKFSAQKVELKVLESAQELDSMQTHSRTKSERIPSVKTDIQTLTTMFFGYKRPSYLAKIKRLEASQDTINLLESIIPRAKPYFSDYF